MNDTLTHELIHAYDHCRAHLDWNNLQHLACTEVSNTVINTIIVLCTRSGQLTSVVTVSFGKKTLPD